MGFWGKLGKVALKAAPYAAMAIPGVGVPLGMAISGATGAASKKLSGGSWKDALLSGGVDAGLSAIPGAKAAKGIAPSAKVVGKATLRNTVGNVGKSVLSGMTGGTGGSEGGWKDALKGAVTRVGQNGIQLPHSDQAPNLGNRGNLSPYAMNLGGNAMPRDARSDPGYDRFASQARRTLGPIGGNLNQNNPNLADSIASGRMTAIRNQPFRQGSSVTYTGKDDAGVETKITNQLPKIYPTGRRNRRPALAE